MHHNEPYVISAYFLTQDMEEQNKVEFFHHQCKNHPHSLTSLLAHLKVIFTDKPGQGTGVIRSLLTAVASAFLTEEHLPNLDHVYWYLAC